jgi:epoxyqueuosine reductase
MTPDPVSKLSALEIKARARELGFDLCGVAPVDDHPELAFLQEWLDRGYAGKMAFMAGTAEFRRDVRAVMPSARTVIVTGTLYNTDRPYSTDVPPGTARISRYAWGDDYHDVLKPRLAALVAWMRDRSDEPFDALAYVDTGPVQERVYAQYAGLGWIGKNTCLINPELGSWLFLGVILTSLPLEPDAQGLEQCGTCTRCLDACPTKALVEPGVLDSTRCLSYLTIELRSAIPEALRPALGAHVYGCDVCQDVCPYNRPAPVSTDPHWLPRPGLDLPALAELWSRPDGEWRSAIEGTPMTRAKVTGLRRNVAVALGASGDGAAAGVLEAGGPDRPSVSAPGVQQHVAWALARLGSAPSTPPAGPAGVDPAQA